jgi:hypothetical protein
MVCIFLRKSTIFKYIFLKKLENNTFKLTMKTFLVCLLLVQLFVACTIAQTNIPSTQQCLHEGRWNFAANRCDCYPGYSGIWCQIANCNLQTVACGLFSSFQCDVTTIKNYCPRLCNARSCTCPNGIDQCLNGGTFNSATCTCSCPSGFTGTVCETISTLTCKNSGTFNNVTKTCSCFPNYSGQLCQNLNCLLPDPAICVSFLTADCNITTLGNYCPNKCGRC